MIDKISLLKHILSINESDGYVEFKENFDPERDGKNISAISNIALIKGKDFGYLVYGIQDKTKKIIGTKFNLGTKKIGNQNLEIWLNQKLSPKIIIEFYELMIEGKKVIILQIPATKSQPIKFDKKSYIRIGESTSDLDKYPDLEEKIWNNEKNKNFEKGIALSDLSLDDVLKKLDYDKYFFLTKQELPTEKVNFLEKMEQDKLVKKQNDGNYTITILGAILFARDLEDFPRINRKKVRIITYDGINKVKRKNDVDLDKGYAVGFKYFIEQIISQVGGNEELIKIVRTNIKMYPEVALREFIANALIHQDFSITGAGPTVEIFSNRIEITNPGNPLIDTDRFIDHPPISRNEQLASLMRRFGFCEESGSGVDRALLQIEVYQLPAPKFENYDNFTKVTLYAPKKLKEMSEDDKTRACYQHCILKYIQGEEKMTNKSLRERLDISEANYPTASKIISLTIKKGKIKESDKQKEYIPWRA